VFLYVCFGAVLTEGFRLRRVLGWGAGSGLRLLLKRCGGDGRLKLRRWGLELGEVRIDWREVVADMGIDLLLY